MKMNRVQFQSGLSMPEFFERYGTEAKRQTALNMKTRVRPIRPADSRSLGRCRMRTQIRVRTHGVAKRMSITTGVVMFASGSTGRLPTLWLLVPGLQRPDGVNRLPRDVAGQAGKQRVCLPRPSEFELESDKCGGSFVVSARDVDQ